MCMQTLHVIPGLGRVYICLLVVTLLTLHPILPGNLLDGSPGQH